MIHLPLSLISQLKSPVGVTCATALFALLSWQASARPNVIVVMTDDQGWGDLSLHGNTTIATPNLDRMAQEGVRFDYFYVQPVCSPTRAEFLTGRYHARSRVTSTSQGGERIDLDEETIADVFREAGYATGVFGKWHSGSQYPYHPMGRGFDEFYGFTSGHWGLYYEPMIEHNGEMILGRGYLPDDITDRTLDFVEAQVEAKRPFFTFLAFNTPHSPMQITDRFWKKYEAIEINQGGTQANREKKLHTKAALAMCENIDWNMGRLFEHLKGLGVDEETIVLFLSDNGPNGNRFNGGFRGRKGSTDEGGVRSPLFVRWPGTIDAGQRVDRISGVIDLLPTLTDLAGIEYQPRKPLDGLSLKSLIFEEDEGWPDRVLVANWRGRVSPRNQRFRLDPAGRLYDIEADPAQERDLALEYPIVVEELQAYLTAWADDVLEGGPKSLKQTAERPFTVGHADFPVTYLPARDAEASGSIERSNRHPNDSFFKNWISEKDVITWGVEVLEPGRYEAEIWYTCAEADVGCTIELGFKDARTAAKVLEPHDPPFLGQSITRYPVQESPVKMFRRMHLGSIELEAGVGEMQLRAPEISGQQAIDFRLLSLTRIQ
jgi:arylsulfatase A-like enzyme